MRYVYSIATTANITPQLWADTPSLNATTARKSIDGTLTLLKWPDSAPASAPTPIYSKADIAAELATDVWEAAPPPEG